MVNEPVVELTGKVCGDVLRVSKKLSCNRVTPDKLFTINLYRTTTSAMINGAQYKTFMCSILPNITSLITEYGDIFKAANEEIKA